MSHRTVIDSKCIQGEQREIIVDDGQGRILQSVKWSIPVMKETAL